jgi:hypothetical protein
LARSLFIADAGSKLSCRISCASVPDHLFPRRRGLGRDVLPSAVFSGRGFSGGFWLFSRCGRLRLLGWTGRRRDRSLGRLFRGAFLRTSFFRPRFFGRSLLGRLRSVLRGASWLCCLRRLLRGTALGRASLMHFNRRRTSRQSCRDRGIRQHPKPDSGGQIDFHYRCDASDALAGLLDSNRRYQSSHPANTGI